MFNCNYVCHFVFISNSKSSSFSFAFSGILRDWRTSPCSFEMHSDSWVRGDSSLLSVSSTSYEIISPEIKRVGLFAVFFPSRLSLKSAKTNCDAFCHPIWYEVPYIYLRWHEVSQIPKQDKPSTVESSNALEFRIKNYIKNYRFNS